MLICVVSMTASVAVAPSSTYLLVSLLFAVFDAVLYENVGISNKVLRPDINSSLCITGLCLFKSSSFEYINRRGLDNQSLFCFLKTCLVFLMAYSNNQ